MVENEFGLQKKLGHYRRMRHSVVSRGMFKCIIFNWNLIKVLSVLIQNDQFL